MKLKGISILPKMRKNKGYNGSGDKFYQSKEWREFRNNYLTMHPLCKICADEGKTELATVLDHIQPIRQGGSVWAEYNLQGLCTHHNAIKTALDQNTF